MAEEEGDTAPMAVDEPAEESSGEESSGEEESGEEEEGATKVEVPAVKEEPDDRLEGESKAARDKRVFDDQMREARATRKEGAAEADAAMLAKNQDIDRQKKDLAKKRMKFLMKQADVFGKFIGIDAMNKLKAEAGEGPEPDVAGAPPSPGKRHRMTEKEEDEMYMKQQAAEQEEVIVRVTKEQTKGFIGHGEMRDYQVEGLNWIVRLYHRGLNGILADEMGLGKTLQTISMLGYLHTFKNINGPHLVVVPKSTLGNWINEFKKWFPQLRVLKFYGSKDERALIRERDLQYGKFDVVATSYEVVIREKSCLSKFSWEYLIIDEAHRIKNENSTLSQIVRIYNTKCRLLITGTPLQNNLHELWALLNFLLPDVFSDANVFETFTNAVGDEKQEIINQLHKVLKPFILRRLKKEVERGLPDKKELTVYCKMTRSQKVTYQAVLKNNVEVLNARKGERTKLLNIVMQLRKACNHPYLFDGVEDKTLDPFGEHLVEQSGKLTLLDKLLPRLQSQGSRVLIFSQMTRLLDILEDYCAMRSHLYCRIDGQTNGEVRDKMIDDYNAPGSKHFIFLLSTRAGGLGINLTSADIVVLYDSDWNPQMDLQAQDRAHRIGQTKPVKVFRLITESTIEEKILDRAMKKLHLDALVIQSGRLAEKEKNMSKDELMSAIRYGADDVFKSDNLDDDEEVDIDAILAKAEEKTQEENKKWEAAKKDGINSRAWTFDGDEELGNDALSGMGGATGFIDIGKRDRKQITYSENEQAKYSGAVDGPAKQKVHRAKEVTFYDYQFFDQAALRPLLEKERGIVRVDSGGEEKVEFVAKEELTEEEEATKEELLKAGFAEWGRRDFQAFIRANEKHGRSNIAALAKEIEGKDEAEVRRYAEVFWERGEELSEWPKLVSKIEEGEKRLERQHDINRAIQLKVKRYKNPLFEMKFNYGASKGKAFNEEADRYLICMTHKLGWGQWEELKYHIRSEPLFRFDWFLKSRTPLELKRRIETLVRTIEKELEGPLKKDKEKRRASVGGGKRKASLDGATAGAGKKKKTK